MNICIVTDYSYGGAYSSAVNQCRSLEQAGHHVLFLALSDPRRRITSSFPGISVKPSFNIPGLLPVLRCTETHIARYERILKKHEIDVVHVQSEFGLAYALVRAARRAGIPVIYTVHTFYWTYTWPFAMIPGKLLHAMIWWATGRNPDPATLAGNTVEHILKRQTLTIGNLADLVISPSAHQAKDLQSAGLTSPCTVQPNPYYGPYAGEPQELPPTEGLIRFVWANRCDALKRPLEMIAAAHLAAARTNRPFVIDVLGDGPMLRQMRLEAGPAPYLVIHGLQPYADVIKYMDQSHAALLSSYLFDNQPMIIAEAVSRHRGILFCDDRLTEGLTLAGYRAAGPSPEQLADALVDLIEHPAKLRELSQGAKSEAEQFTPATFVAAYEEMVKAVQQRTKPIDRTKLQ